MDQRALLGGARFSWRRRPNIDRNAVLQLQHPLDPSILAMVNGLLTACKELSLCKKPRVCQRVNSTVISRRVASLCPLFEDVRDSGVWIPPSALSAFRQLRTAFHNIKTLIYDCRHSSNLLLLMEQDVFASQFRDLSISIADALASLPFDLLEISQDTREYVEIVQRHGRQAKPFIDPAELVLQTEILAVMAALEEEVSPDPEKLRHIFETLHFNDAADCERELWLLEKKRESLKSEEEYKDIPNVNSLISLVRYARCMVYGLGPGQQVAAAFRRYELASPSMRRVVLGRVESTDGEVTVPEDFLCPISLEIMVDPVTIASGQTYERSAITRWFEEGHTTCPKTGSKLADKYMIPNSSLRRLISRWCAENDYVLENVAAKKAPAPADAVDPPSTKAALEATKLTAEFLVAKLTSESSEVQQQAAYELRLLAKEGMDNRNCVGAAGAVPALAALLDSPDTLTQENAVTALLNLSISDKNKDLIMGTEGVLDRIVQVLNVDTGPSVAARENAAAALFCLSTVKEHRAVVGSRITAIEGLLRILREGRPRGRKDAAATLFNLALNGELTGLLLRKGVVLSAIHALEGEKGEDVADEVVALLAVIVRRPDGLAAVSAGIGRVLTLLVDVMAEGSSRTKEHVVSLLLSVCSRVSEAGGTTAGTRQRLRECASFLPALRRLHVGGTPRAQRKAASLLKVLQRPVMYESAAL